MQPMSTLRSLFKLYKPFRWKIIIVACLLLLVSVAGLAVPYFFGRIVESITSNGITAESWRFVGYAALASVGMLLLRYIQLIYEEHHIDHDIPEHLRIITVKKAQELSVNQHMNENSGRLQSVVNTGEASTTQIVLGTFIYNILPTTIHLIVTIGIIAFVDWRIAVWLGLGVGMLVYTVYYFQHKFRWGLKELEEKRHDRNTFLSEILRNFVVIKLFGSDNKVVKKFIDISNDYLTHAKELFSKIVSQHTMRGTFIEAISFGAIIISMFGILQGRYDIAIFVALFGWVQSATGRLGNIYGVIRRLTDGYPKMEKYLEFLNIASDISFGTYTAQQITGSIEFKNVVYTYSNKGYLKRDDTKIKKVIEKPAQALRGVSFTISPGQTVALVGPSGAGKSTIVQMLLGAYVPDKGTVFIDSTPLAQYNIDTLRQFIGYVPQQIDPFDDTIRANIELGLPESKNASHDMMQQAIRIAALDDVIRRAPYGLDTKIGEKGIKLSGGERQRLGIARALIRDPRILIFDEATSNLDTKNEHLITEAVNRITKDRTTIIIAHRLATVAHADKIIFVKDGKVAAEGTHKELLEISADYKELVEHQLVLG